MNKKAVHSKSFAQNMFRGILEPEQVFPYPKVIFFKLIILESIHTFVNRTKKFENIW